MMKWMPSVSLPAASAGNHTDMRLAPFTSLGVPHAVAGLQSTGSLSARGRDNSSDYAAARLAMDALLRGSGFPEAAFSELEWCRDALGRPFVAWSGETEAWAEANGRESSYLHVSNTHDGGAHIVITAYSPNLAGIGIDVVWLPRLRRPGKDAIYLRRFARQFMSQEEWTAFETGIDHPFVEIASATGPKLPAENDPDELLRLRVAAHFSLMEAASKACGTGLKIGAGMGRATSLPKQSLGALRVAPQVDLVFGPEARQRLSILGASRYEACVRTDSEFLITVVALYRSMPESDEKEAGGTGNET